MTQYRFIHYYKLTKQSHGFQPPLFAALEPKTSPAGEVFFHLNTTHNCSFGFLG